MTEIIWIGRTTRYRGGSVEFGIAARTMRREIAALQPDCKVVVETLDGKADFRCGYSTSAAATARCCVRSIKTC